MALLLACSNLSRAREAIEADRRDISNKSSFELPPVLSDFGHILHLDHEHDASQTNVVRFEVQECVLCMASEG